MICSKRFNVGAPKYISSTDWLGCLILLLVALAAIPRLPACLSQYTDNNGDPAYENSIDKEPIQQVYKQVACGTIVNNITSILVTNPHHPEPTYVNSICETVIERANRTVTKLRIDFRKLELYRPNSEGQCRHDRFAVYTDLNVPITPILCGDLTGKMLIIPFPKRHMSLILSVTTSDLDHDRFWEIAVDQQQ